MNAGINIGEFEEVVELLDCVTSKDQRGAKVETYISRGRHMAKVEVEAVESDADYNVLSSGGITITMYKMPCVTTRWRVKWHGLLFNIRNIDPGERLSPFMRLQAEEVLR